MSRPRSIISGTVVALACLTPATALAAEGHGFEWQVHGLYILDFLVLVGLLYWFGRKGVKSFLEERSRVIAHEITEAQKLREKAEAKLQEYEGRLAALEAERKRIVEAFVEDGERERDRIIREAEKSAEKMVRDAERRVTQETKRLEQALEREAIELAITMGESLVKSRLTAEAQGRIVGDYVAGLESMDKKDVFANA